VKRSGEPIGRGARRRIATRAIASIALAAVALLATGLPASAHTRSMSYSTWRLDPDGARIELRIKLLELTRQPPGHPWESTLPDELRLWAGGAPCAAEPATRSAAAPEGWAIFRWRVRCEQSGLRSIESRLLEGVAASHTHFLRIDPSASDASDARIRERVLMTGRDGPWPLDTPAGEAPPSSLTSFVWLGALHIAGGWDHLAFVLALLLLAASLREVAGLVTGFTVGHSLTLGLAVLGVVRPDAVAVEALIGFSIALVAAENTWLLARRDHVIPRVIGGALLVAAGLAALGDGTLSAVSWLGLALFTGCHFALLRRTDRPGGLRAAVAFAFGLVHGFGFAGILMELALPTDQLVSALFGFNVGVELGQLAVVAAVWPLLQLLARSHPRQHLRVAELGSATIFALGIFWLVSRNY
jgi:hypothetical protein